MKMSEAYYLRVVFFSMWDLSGPVIISCWDMTGGLCGKLAIWGLRWLPSCQCVSSAQWVTVCFDTSPVKGPRHIDMLRSNPGLTEWQLRYFCVCVCVRKRVEMWIACCCDSHSVNNDWQADCLQRGDRSEKMFDCTFWQRLSSLKARYSQWCTTDLVGTTQVVLCHTQHVLWVD